MNAITSREEKASRFLKSMGWLRSYEDTESAARSVAEAAQEKIDQLNFELNEVRDGAQRQVDKLNLRIAELKSNPLTPYMHYAAAALTGLLACPGLNHYQTSAKEMAGFAEKYAKEMIATHHKPTDETERFK